MPGTEHRKAVRQSHLDEFTALHNNSRMNDARVAKVTILVNLVRSVGAAG